MYWRLAKTGFISEKTIIVEIDFPAVIKRKINLIAQSKELQSKVPLLTDYCDGIGYVYGSDNYILIGVDLSNVSRLEEICNLCGLQYDAPTLFLSECAVTYMRKNEYAFYLVCDKCGFSPTLTCSSFSVLTI